MANDPQTHIFNCFDVIGSMTIGNPGNVKVWQVSALIVSNFIFFSY